MRADAGLAQALLEAMSEAVYVVDLDRRITYWNPAAERLTGFAAGDVVGRLCLDGVLNHVDEAGEMLCRDRCPLMSTMRDGMPAEASVFLHHRDGHRVPVAISASALVDADGTVRGAVEVFHDDTQYRRIADQLDAAEAAACTDPLTGIANRRTLYGTLQRHQSEQRRYGRSFAVLFADVDHFKAVNDKYSHEVGDRVLQVVASTMRECVRPSDTVGRWGGDEFLIIAPITRDDQAFALAERIRNMVGAGWIDVDDSRVSVTLSVGVAIVQDKEPARALVDRADVALLSAKTHGRNRTVVA